jgi:hypothetical protein
MAKRKVEENYTALWEGGRIERKRNGKKRRNGENEEGSGRERKKVRVRVVYIYVTLHKYSCVLLN